MYNYCPNCGNKVGEKVLEFKCKNCGKSFYANSKPTATVVPLYKNEILVCIRAQEPHKGAYDLFGGFLHNREHPLDGALREFKEETDVDIQKQDLEYLGIWVDDYDFEGTTFATFNMIYILPLKEKIEIEVADDVADFKWVSLDTDIKFAFPCEDEIFLEMRKKYLNTI